MLRFRRMTLSLRVPLTLFSSAVRVPLGTHVAGGNAASRGWGRVWIRCVIASGGNGVVLLSWSTHY